MILEVFSKLTDSTIRNYANKNKMSPLKEGRKVILKFLSNWKGGRTSFFFLMSYSYIKKNIYSSSEASIPQEKMKEQTKHITSFSKTVTESDTLTYYPVSSLPPSNLQAHT